MHREETFTGVSGILKISSSSGVSGMVKRSMSSLWAMEAVSEFMTKCNGDVVEKVFAFCTAFGWAHSAGCTIHFVEARDEVVGLHKSSSSGVQH
jgi:hypothetical protein